MSKTNSEKTQDPITETTGFKSKLGSIPNPEEKIYVKTQEKILDLNQTQRRYKS